MIEIKHAEKHNIDMMVSFLSIMQDELKEFHFDKDIVKQSILQSFDEGVIWFLFQDKQLTKSFGLCGLFDRASPLVGGGSFILC